jgi:hypothetical protein
MIPENLPPQEQSGATPAASTGNDAGNNPGSDNPSSSVSPQSILADLNRLCREGQLEFLFRLEDSSILEGTGYAVARAEMLQLGQEARRLGQEATANAAEAIESAKEALQFASEQHQKALEWKEKLDHITPKPKKTGREEFIDELLRQGVEWEDIPDRLRAKNPDWAMVKKANRPVGLPSLKAAYGRWKNRQQHQADTSSSAESSEIS